MMECSWVAYESGGVGATVCGKPAEFEVSGMPFCASHAPASATRLPFPLEPAFGSPEAVAQAAETIRKPFAGPDDPVTSTCWDCGYTWKRGQDGSHSCVSRLQGERDALQKRVGQSGKVQEDVITKRRASTGAEVHYFIGPIREALGEAEEDRKRWASAPDLLREGDALQKKVDALATVAAGACRERDALQAEVDQLRRGVESWKAEEEDWKSLEAKLLAEVERLRTCIDSITTSRDDMEIQRDALADALVKVRARLPRWILSGIEVGRTGRDVDLKGAFADEIESALRIAGRLPATTKGDFDGNV